MILKTKLDLLDKTLLADIVRIAKDKYLDNGNSDGVQYLEPAEIVARAYAEATLFVLESRGLKLKPLSKD